MIDEFIKELREVKDAKAELKKKLKDLNGQETYLEGALIEALHSEGLSKATSDLATASLTRKSYPSVKDWDKALPFIKAGHTELLTKKINAAAYRELKEAGIDIPGVESFDKETLNFRRK